jgi:4-hydroxybenzoate polyprenyltransferase
MIIRQIIVAMRPYQWFKNMLVFAALFFSKSFYDWNNVYKVTFAFILFCLASSAVYIMNDLRDIEEDKIHPVKKLRPIASGKIKKSLAIVLMTILFIASLGISFYFSMSFFIIITFYVTLNIGYSMGLKKVVILDVILLSIGFLLRAIAGAIVISLEASPWLFICTLMLALLLGFGKRYNELKTLCLGAEKHRITLKEYSLSFLEKLMVISAATASVTYSLYTMSAETLERLHSRSLIYTTPMVLFGIFRYLYLVLEKNSGGDPTKLLLFDLQMIANFSIWVITVFLILSGIF